MTKEKILEEEATRILAEAGFNYWGYEPKRKAPVVPIGGGSSNGTNLDRSRTRT